MGAQTSSRAGQAVAEACPLPSGTQRANSVPAPHPQAALRRAPGGATPDLLSALGLCQVSQGDLQVICGARRLLPVVLLLLLLGYTTARLYGAAAAAEVRWGLCARRASRQVAGCLLLLPAAYAAGTCLLACTGG